MTHRMMLLAVVALGLAARSVASSDATFAGDAAGSWPAALAATSDGGAVHARNRLDRGGAIEGLVLRATADDGLAWARRLPFRLSAVAALPDGGALVAGDAWLGRFDGAGTLAWQQRWSAPVRSVACRDYRCAVAIDDGWRGEVSSLDGATGVVEWTVGPAAFELVRAHQVLALADGDVLVGATWREEDDVRTLAVRLDAAGGTRWAVEAAPPDWLDREAMADPGPAALAELADGTLVIASQSHFGEGTASVLSADGRTLAWMRPSCDTPLSVVELPDGDVLASCANGRMERWTRDGRVADAWDVGTPPASGALLATAADGSLLVSGWTSSRLPAVPEGSASCPIVAPAALDARPGAASSRRGPIGTLDLGPVVSGWRPVPATERPLVACVDTPCLLACETRCLDGVDDDANGRTDCEDPACSAEVACGDDDTDGDGVANRTDCSPADPRASAVPESVVLRVTTCVASAGRVPVVASSSPAQGAPLLDVVRGSLSGLRGGGASADATCVARRISGALLDFAAVAQRDAWWLARERNACGAGPWGDASLDSSGGCP